MIRVVLPAHLKSLAHVGSEVRVEVDGEAFSARLRRGRLRLAPELQPGEWVDRLLTVLSRKAAALCPHR